MANEEQLKLINQGVETWNTWRSNNRETSPDLSRANLNVASLNRANLRKADLHEADLIGATLIKAVLVGAILVRTDLSDANLIGANLSHANISDAILVKANLCDATLTSTELSNANLTRALLLRADLYKANLIGANLSGADLSSANLHKSNLSNANLSRADLNHSNLIGATLSNANLRGTNLSNANLSQTKLDGADLSGAAIGWTTFTDNDLSTVGGLETVKHFGPSSIGIDTMFKSNGEIPESFLRDAGIPEDFITYIPSLVGRAIEFYSCFISYSHQDEEFAKRLHSRMRSENLRVWYAPEEMKGGKKLHEQIFSAIQMHDKLLLILSENSMQSEWVKTEIRRAKKVEREETRRKLFPIRLVDFEAIQIWECFDADSGKDLAVELREYYIPDFSDWKNHDVFESEFAKLFSALRPEQ